MERQEEEGERQEEEECVVRESVDDAVNVAKVPRVSDDLAVQGERDTEAGKKDVPDRKVEQKVVAWKR